MEKCKYYCDKLDTCRALISSLYDVAPSGGCMHIVTDDENIRDSDINFCLRQCRDNPDYVDAPISKTLGEEMLKLTMPQRRLLLLPWAWGKNWRCPYYRVESGELSCDEAESGKPCEVLYAYYTDEENID